MNSSEDGDYTLVANAEMETEDGVGNTPLMLAAKDGKLKIVKLLLDHGANVNAVNQNSDTALNLACAGGHRDVVGKLLAFGADKRIQNKERKNALHLAIEIGDAGIVSLLLHGIVCTESSPELSWLGQQLIDRGLDMQAVQDVEEKFAKEYLHTTKDAIVKLRFHIFNHSYINTTLGITQLGIRNMLLEVRLQSTWLGERLHAKGAMESSLYDCEKHVIDFTLCNTPQSFAHTPFDKIQYISVLQPVERQYLREVHNEVIEEMRARNAAVAAQR